MDFTDFFPSNNGNGAERAPVLIVRNHHVASCGIPPQLNTASADSYVGYFENPFGEQWVFTFNRATGEASLQGGDAGWENVYQVRHGQAEGLILGREEAAWLMNCWATATGEFS